MKVTFHLDNGANIHSCRSQSWDLDNPRDVKRFGFTETEWLAMGETDKDETLHEWATQLIDIYYEETK